MTVRMTLYGDFHVNPKTITVRDVAAFDHDVVGDRCRVTFANGNDWDYLFVVAASAVCDHCGSDRPTDQSCGCFDNACQ